MYTTKNKCCYFVEIRLGSIVIAFVDLILSLLSSFGRRFDLHLSAKDSSPLFNSFWVGVFMVHVFGCLLLLLGVLVENAYLVSFWVVTTFFKIILISSEIVFMLVREMHVKPLIWGLLYIALSIFFLISVYSLYKALRKRTLEH